MQKLFIISGPSGAGEDSVIEGLARIMPIERVITTKTRAMRSTESPGRPYYFITKDEFEAGIKDGKFFEYAQEYNDHYAGVTHDEIQRVQAADHIGIWKIEYKGVMSAKKMLGDKVCAIFITAPLDVLEARIRRREAVTDDFVAERMAYTREWLAHKDIYDYEVENTEGELEKTIVRVADIITQERDGANN